MTMKLTEITTRQKGVVGEVFSVTESDQLSFDEPTEEQAEGYILDMAAHYSFLAMAKTLAAGFEPKARQDYAKARGVKDGVLTGKGKRPEDAAKHMAEDWTIEFNRKKKDVVAAASKSFEEMSPQQSFNFFSDKFQAQGMAEEEAKTMAAQIAGIDLEPQEENAPKTSKGSKDK